MLKFFFVGLVLWQGIYEIASDNDFAEQKTVDSEIRKLQTDVHGPYDFCARSIIFNLNSLAPQNNTVLGPINSLVNVRNTPGAGYRVTSGIGAHKLHLRKLPWNKARQICIEEAGHLAVIRSVLEETIVLQMMTEEGVHRAWLGVHDNFEEGDWVTVMDEPLGRTGWAKWTKFYSVTPDNYKGNENCAHMLLEGRGMNDENCVSPTEFICKISNI